MRTIAEGLPPQTPETGFLPDVQVVPGNFRKFLAQNVLTYGLL